jgi:hypothetical protein
MKNNVMRKIPKSLKTFLRVLPAGDRSLFLAAWLFHKITKYPFYDSLLKMRKKETL